MKHYPLMIIEWKDHASSDEWHSSEEEAINTLGAVRINSVGWLYNEDEESYILASTISLDDAHVTNLIRILKGTVVATKIIRKARNGKADRGSSSAPAPTEPERAARTRSG